MPGSTPAPLPSLLISEPFSTSTALALDVHPGRLRAADLVRPYFGVRAIAVPDTTHDLARAYATWMRPDQYFSHATAAELWQLPMPALLRHDRRLHVTTPGRQRTARGRGVIGHRTTRPDQVRVVDGKRVSSPVRTWFDLAAVVPLDDLVVLGDALLLGTRRLATREHLVDAVTRAPRIPGLARAREAAALVREGSLSPAETSMRLSIVRRGLPEPELNQKVFDADGAYVGRPDFLFRAQGIAVEYEGDYHRTDPKMFRRDIRRRERFEDAGWRVVRATADDLQGHSGAFLDRLQWLLGVDGVDGRSGVRR